MSYKICTAGSFNPINTHESIVLDVRTDMEHAEKRLAADHAHVPLDQLQPADFMMRHGMDKDSGVYILCRSGKRAAQAAEKFVVQGYNNVHVIEGGILACEECGCALKGGPASEKAETAIQKQASLPLERQVRIAAGAIAGTGALLALIVHPAFSLIPLFVGGGLVYAGITDRCGLALILTKAPWNMGMRAQVPAVPAPVASKKESVCS